MKIEQRYLDGSYLQKNPNWDRADATWKADQVLKILTDHKVAPTSVCEIGCGSGDILRSLSSRLTAARLVGYDVSPQLANFWNSVEPGLSGGPTFHLADFHTKNTEVFDLLLMLDVFEHVRDPFSFLEATRPHAKKFVFHIPLDLNAISVARRSPLIAARRNVGHLHFYTKDLALETLTDSGYKIIDWRYTGASLNMQTRSVKTHIARLPRRVAGLINKDWAVRILGGETLVVLAE